MVGGQPAPGQRNRTRPATITVCIGVYDPRKGKFSLGLCVDIAELRVTVEVVAAFPGLAIGLQAVTESRNRLATALWPIR